ncbi:MAG: DNA polymerase III subunit gamma/tau [Candidatus Eisenbacteria bacterium]
MTPDKSGYIVIARKWRPATFDEVIGQEHVSRTLKNAITGERVAHAYLFTGPRGVGKTTVARVLAKSLNCVDGPTTNPCGKCSACTEIAQGTSMDVMEIDGASNRGIDEIRNLRESVRYASVGGKKKVYIIDEVHMLTQEAFNALLKTLEEPPSHVVFVFATTQPLKLPRTIVSRCQRFDFRRIPADKISARLKHICEAEGFTCETNALAMISQRSEGSMRDAQSMLEQVLAFSGGTATEVDIRPIMGLRGSETVSSIAKAIMGGDEAGVLTLTGEAFDGGVDPLDLVVSLTEWIRYLLIASIDAKSRELESLTDETRRELAGEVEGVTTEHLLSLLSMIADAEDSVKRAGHQRYLLESVLLRMTHVRSIAKISTLVELLKKMEGGGPSGDKGLKDAGVPLRDAAVPRPARKKKTAETAQVTPPTAGIVTGWQDIVEGLRETKTALASILDLCEPPKLSEGVYWLQVPSSFHESMVMKGQNMRILTQEFQKLTNTAVVIRTRVSVPAEEAVEDTVRPKDEPTTEELVALANKDPIVKTLIENLGGKVVGIRQQKKDRSQREPAS